MKFIPQAEPTLGCEWELQLLREDSLDLADGILALIGQPDDHALIKPEFLDAIARCALQHYGAGGT